MQPNDTTAGGEPEPVTLDLVPGLVLTTLTGEGDERPHAFMRLVAAIAIEDDARERENMAGLALVVAYRQTDTYRTGFRVLTQMLGI
jgi:hypothetical protein